MQEFYIIVELRQGPTWIQVDEVPPESWTLPGVPEFVIEFNTAEGNELLTIQLKRGMWHDRNSYFTEDTYSPYLNEYPNERWNLNYNSPLNRIELKAIGNAIANYMVVALSGYIGLFFPQYRTPTLN